MGNNARTNSIAVIAPIILCGAALSFGTAPATQTATSRSDEFDARALMTDEATYKKRLDLYEERLKAAIRVAEDRVPHSIGVPADGFAVVITPRGTAYVVNSLGIARPIVLRSGFAGEAEPEETAKLRAWNVRLDVPELNQVDLYLKDPGRDVSK